MNWGWLEPLIQEAVTTAMTGLCQTRVVVSPLRMGPLSNTRGKKFAKLVLEKTPPGMIFFGGEYRALEQLTGRFLIDHQVLTEALVLDALGEFANVIAGQLKTLLIHTPYHFRLSIPEIEHAAQFQETDWMSCDVVTDIGELTFGIQLAFPGA